MNLATTEAQDRIAALESAVAGGEPVPAQTILSALADPSTLVRQRAIALAARHLPPEALGDLLRDDDNAVLRNAAFAALERQGPYAVPYLARLTLDGNNEVATFAVQILALISDAASSHALLPLVDHPDRNIAQSVIEALGSLQVAEAVPTLIRFLEADLWLQFAAVSALGRLGDPRAVRPLLNLISSEMLHEPAIEALGRIGSSEALGPLVKLLYESDRIPLRDHVLRAVASILERNLHDGALLTRIRRTRRSGAGGVVEYLGGLLGADDLEFARAAVTVVVFLQIWELLPAVLLRSADPEEARWLTGLLERSRRQLQRPFLQLLGSSDLRVRRGALSCGVFDGRALPTLLACLDDPEADVRAAACRAIGSLRKPEAIPALVRCLRAGSGAERVAAAHALGLMPGAGLRVLAPDLDPSVDPDRLVTALEILEAAHSSALARQVSALLSDPRPAIRRAALRVAGHHRGQAVESRILALLADSDVSVRTEAVEILVRRRCHRAEGTLISLLSSEEPLRYQVIRGLGRLRVTAAAQPLVQLYPSALPHERVEVIAALNQIAAPGLLPFLKDRLRERDLETRRVASDGLARCASPEHVEDLLALVHDGDWTVRNHVAWGLGRLALPSLREPLLLLARDVEPVVARTARTSLAKLPGEPPGPTG